MKKFVRNGVKFTMFEKYGETYLCTGEPTGELKLDYVGEICDYATVAGATSVVSGKCSVDELYAEWLERTEFYRSIGIRF